MSRTGPSGDTGRSRPSGTSPSRWSRCPPGRCSACTGCAPAGSTLNTGHCTILYISDDPLTCLRPPAVVAALHPLVQIPVVVHQHVIVVNKPGHVLRGEDAVVPSDAGHPAVTEMKTAVKNILITRRTLTGTRKSCRCCPSGTPGSSPSLTRS